MSCKMERNIQSGEVIDKNKFLLFYQQSLSTNSSPVSRKSASTPQKEIHRLQGVVDQLENDLIKSVEIGKKCYEELQERQTNINLFGNKTPSKCEVQEMEEFFKDTPTKIANASETRAAFFSPRPKAVKYLKNEELISENQELKSVIEELEDQLSLSCSYGNDLITKMKVEENDKFEMESKYQEVLYEKQRIERALMKVKEDKNDLEVERFSREGKLQQITDVNEVLVREKAILEKKILGLTKILNNLKENNEKIEQMNEKAQKENYLMRNKLQKAQKKFKNHLQNLKKVHEKDVEIRKDEQRRNLKKYKHKYKTIINELTQEYEEEISKLNHELTKEKEFVAVCEKELRRELNLRDKEFDQKMYSREEQQKMKEFEFIQELEDKNKTIDNLEEKLKSFLIEDEQEQQLNEDEVEEQDFDPNQTIEDLEQRLHSFMVEDKQKMEEIMERDETIADLKMKLFEEEIDKEKQLQEMKHKYMEMEKKLKEYERVVRMIDRHDTEIEFEPIKVATIKEGKIISGCEQEVEIAARVVTKKIQTVIKKPQEWKEMGKNFWKKCVNVMLSKQDEFFTVGNLC